MGNSYSYLDADVIMGTLWGFFLEEEEAPEMKAAEALLQELLAVL